MTGPVEAFREAWRDVRGLTIEFVNAVPESAFKFSPGPGFAPLDKQVRHMICVQGVYHAGLESRPVDFGRKHDHYRGPLEREALAGALRAKDAELDAILERLGEAGASRLSIDFIGRRTSFARYTAVMLQHEAIHHGQWSLYAALGGFATPLSWKLNWGL